MKTNDKALGIIKHFEGCVLTSYQCPAGIWTIGIGSCWDFNGCRITGDYGPITEEEAYDLLALELRHVEKAIMILVKVPLTSDQFGALASFIYNIGSGAFQRSTMRMKLNRLDYEGAADEFWKWRRGGGVILPGLVRRRAVEAELFRQ
ncbi:lysozyme [bacterium]|nr:lysozyme [bacterium]